jgi:uncharacterized protein with HEPN domain
MNGRIENILTHMLEDARDAVRFSRQAASFEVFCDDSMIRKAVVMSLLNIGELASHLPQDYILTHDILPWKAMIGMRNLAAHGYHIMNLEIFWDTAVNSIPELLAFLEKELAQ